MSILRNPIARAAVAVVVGHALFLCCGEIGRLLAGTTELSSVVQRHAIFKGILVAVSLVLWLATRRPWAEMGWRRAKPGGRKWLWYVMAAIAMGSASIAMILTKSRHPLASGMTFPQIVLGVWLLSSISEEIFVRGLVQSWMAAPFDMMTDVRARRIIVFASAALFGGLHVSLIWKGGGWLGGGIIVAATLMLGWAAAEIRARSGSLLHAIAVHIVGSVAAVPFGIVGVILYRIIYGQMPTMN